MKEANSDVQRIMAPSFKEVWDFSQEQRVSLRLGAYMLAVDRVAGTVRDRGVFP